MAGEGSGIGWGVIRAQRPPGAPTRALTSHSLVGLVATTLRRPLAPPPRSAQLRQVIAVVELAKGERGHVGVDPVDVARQALGGGRDPAKISGRGLRRVVG
jgi:hypothetical protein